MICIEINDLICSKSAKAFIFIIAHSKKTYEKALFFETNYSIAKITNFTVAKSQIKTQ